MTPILRAPSAHIRRVSAVLAVVAGVVGVGLGMTSATAAVSAIRGSAFGYSASVNFTGQPVQTFQATPTVALTANGANSPQANSATSGSVIVGPASLFASGQINVNTQGTTGASGSVTSSASISNVDQSNGAPFVASAVASTCTASEAGVSGSTTITGGTLQTDSGDSDGANTIPDHPAVTVAVPANPAPNTTINGHIHVANFTDNFKVVFNEQVVNADGSLTVYAAHQYFLGPLVVGDLFIGKSECGVTAAPVTTTTTSTTAAPPTSTTGATTSTTAATTSTTTGATTSTTAAPTTSTTGATTSTTTASTTSTSTSTSTTAAPTTTTTTTVASTTTTAPLAANQLSGGAYGYYASVKIFTNPFESRGPAPTVDLPAGGSSTPVTASAPSASAQFGPATVFGSGALDVSTQGTAASGVTSSAKVTAISNADGEPFVADAVASTCTASGSDQSASTTLTGAKLTVSQGADTQSTADDTVVQVPASPTINSSYDGKLETVGDSFRVVFNEQISATGAVTVNAVHMYLLGPTAVGDLIIGQSRCATTTEGAAATTGPTTAAGAVPPASTAGDAAASTGGGGGASSGGTTGATSAGTSGAASSGGSSPSSTAAGRLAKTGLELLRLAPLALALIVVGWFIKATVPRRRPRVRR